MNFRIQGSAGRKMKLVLALLVIVGAGWLLASQREAARRVVYVIPAGTAAGQGAVDFPAEIILTVGLKDTLVIENQDGVLHSFGPFVVAPHSTLTKRFDKALVYEGACTFHQDQQMRLVVQPAPWQASP